MIVIESKVATAVVLIGLLLVAAYTPAMADGNEVEIEAELTDCASPCITVPGANGELEYDAEFLSDGVIIKKAVFQVVVTIPVPNSLGINAMNGGTAGLVVIDLTRLNPSSTLAEPYATCTMVLKKAKGTSLTYALKLSSKLKNGQLVTRKKSRGSCDIDLIMANAQTGIPTIQDGDIAFVSANGTDILSSLPSPNEPPSPPPNDPPSPNDPCIACWDY
jgi:hypothetical protein